MAASLLAQTAAMRALADLYDLQNLLARLATNLVAVGSGGAVITVAGANLYALAAHYYGDASEWATIAKANGLTEPMLTGLRTLLIPPVSGKTGGVLREIIGADGSLVELAGAPPVTSGGVSGELDFSDPDDAVLQTL